MMSLSHFLQLHRKLGHKEKQGMKHVFKILVAIHCALVGILVPPHVPAADSLCVKEQLKKLNALMFTGHVNQLLVK